MRLIRPRTRCGHTVAESLVGLLIATLAMAVTARAAGLTLRTEARTATEVRMAHDNADALDVVAERLRDVVPADGDLLAADTGMLAMRVPVGTVTFCAGAGDTLSLAPGDGASPWVDDLTRPPAVGDDVRPVGGLAASGAVARVVAVTAVDAPCAAEFRAWSLRARWRVVLDSAITAPPIGAPVRLLTRERWTAYRGIDGRWALGLAAWGAATNAYDTPQPVVAILDAVAPVFVAEPRDSAGTRVAAGAFAQVRAVGLVLRRRGGSDSVVVRVPTR